MPHEITRHFVSLDGRWGPRQVHYRRAGQGPAVLLLHQSPQSSREMVDLMRRWALHFTLIAPDTPGYGQSDPLGPAEIAVEEFAAALLEFVDAIGLRRFSVYGYHTGASIGLWLAAAHPDRVTGLAANGLVQLTDRERHNILEAYLPPVVPSWDGSHLAWLWARVREQTVFFPWHERTVESRMDFDMPSPGQLQFSLLEFLRAGDNYAIAYRAAFKSRPESVLPALKAPLMVTTSDNDPLRVHLDRLRNLPANAEVGPSGSAAGVLERCLHHLLAHPGEPVPAPPPTRPIPGRLWSTMTRTAHGQTRVRLQSAGKGEPLLLIHGAGGSSETMSRLAAPLLGTRPVVIPDLPGHGESDPPEIPAGPSIIECAGAALGTLGALGITQPVLAGQGSGAWVALETLRHGSFHRPRLALMDVPYLPATLRAAFREHGLPSMEPQWHGGHLLLAWHMLRDGRLFFPWFERTRARALRVAPDLDPQRLHLELRELLKASGSWQNLLRDALDYPAQAALRAAAPHILLAAAAASPWQAATREAANAAPALRLAALPAEPADWLPEVLRAWG